MKISFWFIKISFDAIFTQLDITDPLFTNMILLILLFNKNYFYQHPRVDLNKESVKLFALGIFKYPVFFPRCIFYYLYYMITPSN